MYRYMILGLDASTKTVGFAFYNDNKIVDAGFVDISKCETNKEKSFYFISKIESNVNLSQSNVINLEAALSGFMQGKSKAQTIITLTRFNAVFEYILSENLNKKINLVSVTTARKSVFGKCRIKGMSGKEYVKDILPKIHPEVKQFEKNNTKNEWDARNADMYDACVMACANGYE